MTVELTKVIRTSADQRGIYLQFSNKVHTANVPDQIRAINGRFLRVIEGGRTMRFNPNNLQSSAHEFGHVLGFADRYHHSTKQPFSGYANDIMGNVNAPAGARQVNHLLLWEN